MAGVQGSQVKQGKHKKENRKHITSDAGEPLRILDHRSRLSEAHGYADLLDESGVTVSFCARTYRKHQPQS